jgi:hypothetical protein
LSGFGDASGADAVGTNPHGFVGLSHNNPNALKIRIPSPVRQIVRVADPMSVHRAFVTDFAACHEGHLPLLNKRKV